MPEPPFFLIRRVLLSVMLILCSGVAPPTAVHAQDRPGSALPSDDPLWQAASPFLSVGAAQGRMWTIGGATGTEFLKMVSGLPRSVARDRLIRLSSNVLSDTSASETHWGIRLRAAATGTAQEGTDPWRRPMIHEPDVYQLVQYESFVRLGNWSAGFGWRHDGMYERDPEALDAALRWSIRSENTYVRYDGRWVGASVGRTAQHWGAPGGSGLLLSDNPRPMDHLSFRFGTPTLSVRSSINELDSITSDGRFTGLAGDDSVRVGSERRFLAVHRLDIRVSRSWSAALLHSTLYSGTGSGLSLKFINPFNVGLFTVDNRPKNDENNGFLGLEVRHVSDRRAVMMQVMIDDIDILNGSEPASVAATVFAQQHIGAASWLSFDALVVSARAYKTLQPEGTYVYLLRGIGPQDADVVHVSTRLGHSWTPGQGLVHAEAGLDLRWQGGADILDPFPAAGVGTILSDPTVRYVRPHVKIHAFTVDGWYATLDAGMMSSGRDVKLSGHLAVGYRVQWSGSLN